MEQSIQQKHETRSPIYVAFQDKGRVGAKAIWTQIGGAWPHADGKGFTLQLEALPLNGRITLRRPEEKAE